MNKNENKSVLDRAPVGTNENLGSTIGLQKGMVDTRNPDILKAQESKDSIIYIDKYVPINIYNQNSLKCFFYS